jgi:hypothetical protein
MSQNEKIRPPARQQQSQFKDQDEADLPGVARAPDPGGVRPEAMIGALNATEAAAARATHLDPNALGRKFKPNEAEQLLAAYLTAKATWKEAYARTRIEDSDEREAFYAAKRACMAAGLLDPNS